ncbi:MAG: nucleotidyltransferase domain-containing protein [Cyanobacteria bacterium J06621_8]
MKQKQREGWEVARKCADVLKKEFGVTKVCLFGSMLDVEQIRDDSDIDLAVWGLGIEDLWRAGAAVDQVLYDSYSKTLHNNVNTKTL